MPSHGQEHKLLSVCRQADPSLIANATNGVIKRALEKDDVWGAIEPYRPVIDGQEFAKQPMELFKAGEWSSNKEIIIGTNSQELVYILEILGDTVKRFTPNEFKVIALP